MRGCLIFWGKTPKITTFSGSDFECLWPQYSARRMNFQKSQWAFVLGYNPRARQCTPFQYRRYSNQKTKSRFCPFRHYLQPNGWGIADIKMRCNFTIQSSSLDAELKLCIGLFEKFSDGLRYRGVSAYLSVQNQKK